MSVSWKQPTKTVVKNTKMYLGQRLLRLRLFFAIALVCWLPMCLGANAEYFNVIEKLHEKLLKSYNKQIRPVISHTETLNVDVSMQLTSFDFDEHKSRFSAKGFLFMSWKDPRFTWSPSDYEGLENIHLPSEIIWSPDLEVYNSPGILSKDRSFANTEALITSNGTVYFVPITNLISNCIPNPTLYPFDSVTCTTKIGSWSHNAHQMRINPKNNETKVFMADLISPQMFDWTLVDTKVVVDVKIYDCCPEPYQSIILTFNMKRSFSTLAAIVTPTVAIIILTLATFFIPPAVSAKVFVGMINLAILCGYSLYFHANLPSGNGKTPYIVSFYCGSLILVVISIVSSIFCLRWVRLAKSSPPPTFIQSCLSSTIGRILGVAQQDNRIRSLVNDPLTEKKGQETVSDSNDSRDNVKQQWMNICLALDRIMFFAYCLVFTFFFICYFG